MIIVIEDNSIGFHKFFFLSILLHNADDSIDVTNDEEPEQEPETDQQQAAILPVPGFVPPASLYNHAQETVYETSARLLFMAVKWAKNLPRYFSISYLLQLCAEFGDDLSPFSYGSLHHADSMFHKYSVRR